MGVCQLSLRFVLAASVPMLFIGCKSRGYEGPQRAKVSGTVTFNGAPVQQGSLNLLPLGGDASRPSGAAIEAGKYLITEDQGPTFGKYKVEFFIFEPPKKAAAEGVDAGMVQVAPPKLNKDSTIEIDIQSAEVEQNFDLKP